MKQPPHYLSILLLLGCCFACDNAVQDSNPKAEQQTKTLDNETVTIFNKSSQTTSKVPFKDGKKSGLAKQYYPDGSIWKESNYKDGTLHGIAKVFERDGSIKRMVEYKNGKKDGSYIKYFKSGNPKMEAAYIEDLIQPGITEKDFKGNDIAQPSIVMTEDDKMMTSNIFSVYFALNKAVKDVRFYAFDEPNMWNSETVLGDYQLPLRNKAGFIEFQVKQGYYLALKLYVYATYTTKSGNEAVVYNEFNIAAENRVF